MRINLEFQSDYQRWNFRSKIVTRSVKRMMFDKLELKVVDCMTPGDWVCISRPRSCQQLDHMKANCGAKLIKTSPAD